MKRRAADAERIFANHPSGPRLVSEYIKNPPKSLIGKKKKTQLKNAKQCHYSHTYRAEIKNKKQNLTISSVGEKKQLECFTICETGKAAVTPDKGSGLS